MRRLLTLAATVLISAVATVALAQERATFVMSSGRQINGTFSRGPSDNAHVEVNTYNGAIQVATNEIAVIDFGTVRPSERDFDRLPSRGNQVLVMRNGRVREGQWLGFTAGDAFGWRDAGGQPQTVLTRDVQRVVLNPAAARYAYGYQPRGHGYGRGREPESVENRPVNANRGGHTPGALARASAIPVPANTSWIDTEVEVRAGDLLTFNAQGQVGFANGSSLVSAGGRPDIRSATFPVPNAPVGALVGRVADSAPFLIGATTTPIRMPATGRLQLAVNDDARNDNSGAFTVFIRWAE